MINANYSYIALGKQADASTIASSFTNFVKFESESLKKSIEKIEDNVKTGQRFTDKIYSGTQKNEGSISSITPDLANLGVFLNLAGFQDSAALKDGSTGVYIHTMTLTEDDADLDYYTIQKYNGLQLENFIGSLGSKFELSCSVNELLKLSVDIKALTHSKSTDVTVDKQAPSYQTTYVPFTFVHGILKIESTEVEISKFSIVYENALGENYKLGQATPKSLNTDKSKIDISLETLLDSASDTLQNYFYANTEKSIELYFQTTEEIETGHKGVFKLMIPRAIIDDWSGNIGTESKINVSIALKALANYSGETITGIIENLQSAVY